MCSRDSISYAERLAERRRDQQRFELVQEKAYVGCRVHLDRYSRWGKPRWYFRRRTMYFMGHIPMHTTEVLMPARTRVCFTELSDAVRKEFRLTSQQPMAEVVKRRGRTGFVFDEGSGKRCFPLQRNSYFAFEIVALPPVRRRVGGRIRAAA